MSFRSLAVLACVLAASTGLAATTEESRFRKHLKKYAVDAFEVNSLEGIIGGAKTPCLCNETSPRRFGVISFQPSLGRFIASCFVPEFNSITGALTTAVGCSNYTVFAR
jgi:hypothetical protein